MYVLSSKKYLRETGDHYYSNHSNLEGNQPPKKDSGHHHHYDQPIDTLSKD